MCLIDVWMMFEIGNGVISKKWNRKIENMKLKLKYAKKVNSARFLSAGYYWMLWLLVTLCTWHSVNVMVWEKLFLCFFFCLDDYKIFVRMIIQFFTVTTKYLSQSEM